MAATVIYIGDTVKFRAEFRDENDALIDPDGSAATATIYNFETLATVTTGAATRLSQGIYIFQWTVPAGDGVQYIFEMKGLFTALPELKRIRVKAKFRPSA